MSLDSDFLDAQVRVRELLPQPDEVLLNLYGLFKQGNKGDVSGDRPGESDTRARAKYDAWAHRQGMEQDEAKKAYIALVDKMEGR
jgi:acyl-CoA-binding protein